MPERVPHSPSCGAVLPACRIAPAAICTARGAFEARALAAKGVADPLAGVRISESARVITPFHQAACGSGG